MKALKINQILRGSAIPAMLLLAAALGMTGCDSSNSTADSGKGGGKGKGKGGGGAVPVEVATAQRRSVPVEVQVVGTAEAFASNSVKSQATGQIMEQFFTEGDFVKAGDKLFKIDSSSVEAQIRTAEVTKRKDESLLSQAEANLQRDAANAKYQQELYERTKTLVDQGITAKEQGEQLKANAEALSKGLDADRASIESAKMQIQSDQAAINALNVQLGYTIVYAGITGRTGNVAVKVGNVVTANTLELLTINQVEPIYVTFSVPEAHLADIKKYSAAGKLPVTAKAQDGSGGEARGTLAFIDNAVDTSTGTIKLKGRFENADRSLWPGQFLNVTLGLTTRPNAVTVPSAAVQNGQDGQFVYVVKEDRSVEMRPITAGSRTGDDFVIEKGLEAGEMVVTVGQLRIDPKTSRVQLPGDRPQGRGAKGGDKTGDAAPQGDGGDGRKGKGEFKGKGDFKAKESVYNGRSGGGDKGGQGQ